MSTAQRIADNNRLFTEIDSTIKKILNLINLLKVLSHRFMIYDLDFPFSLSVDLNPAAQRTASCNLMSSNN